MAVTLPQTPYMVLKVLFMKCPYCGELGTSHVVDTSVDASGHVKRRRECDNCGNRYNTSERPMLSTPALIKTGGYREDFEREKLLQSLKIACVKRPVSAEDLDSLVNSIEASLRQMGEIEVSSKVVGDMVMEGLRELDNIAYIRFAIVYLKLDNLSAIKQELENLISDQI